MKLLLLHPLPLDGSIFSNGLRALVHECVSPTLYSEGADLKAWARSALDAVGQGPVVVVGNSIGGSCAIEVAMLAPTKVKALVLCGAKAGHRPEPELRDEALGVLESQCIDIAWERYWRPLFGPDASTAVVEQGWQTAQKIGAAAIAAGVRAFHSRVDREDFLLKWDGRVVLVDGEHDRPERSRRFAERHPNGSSHRIGGVGHYLPLEAPETLTSITAGVLAAA